MVDPLKRIDSGRECYGCGVCSISCPRDIIEIKINPSGFYAPYITDEDACLNCGLCARNCALNYDKPVRACSPIATYAAWSKDEDVRYSSTSGGVSYEIFKSLFAQDYSVCGVRYNTETSRAEHFIARTPSDLALTMGSKYMQSYTVDAFKQLNHREKCVVIGLPCQIDSLRRYLDGKKKTGQYVLVDLFCHGVPSVLLWKLYEQDVAHKVGEIKNVRFRDKTRGWKRSYCMILEGGVGRHISHLEDGDIYLNMFLGNNCLNKPCYNQCKYKQNSSSADIRIGDFWGWKEDSQDMGVSAVVVYSEVGKQIIENANLCLEQVSFGEMSREQMQRPARRGGCYYIIMYLLSHRFPFGFVKLCAAVNHIIKKIVWHAHHPLRTIDIIKHKLFK